MGVGWGYTTQPHTASVPPLPQTPQRSLQGSCESIHSRRSDWQVNTVKCLIMHREGLYNMHIERLQTHTVQRRSLVNHLQIGKTHFSSVSEKYRCVCVCVLDFFGTLCLSNSSGLKQLMKGWTFSILCMIFSKKSFKNETFSFIIHLPLTKCQGKLSSLDSKLKTTSLTFPSVTLQTAVSSCHTYGCPLGCCLHPICHSDSLTVHQPLKPQSPCLP